MGCYIWYSKGARALLAVPNVTAHLYQFHIIQCGTVILPMHRPKVVFIATQLNSTQLDVELS